MRIVLIVLVAVLLSPALGAAAFIPASENYILYTGRWDDSNRAEPWAYAKGASVIAVFSGTSLSARISATSTDYLRIIIDGDAANSTKMPITYGTASYSLATGLTGSSPSHTVEIVKETDAGRWTFLGFELDDGAGLVLPPARPPRRLAFYGDSNLAGYSLEHEQNRGDLSLQGAHYGYAGITSRMFGAEYSNISRSGATIRSLHASFDRIDWFNRGTTWDFSKFQPDAVVINIGANDVGRPVAKMKKDYHALLDDMRAVYPDAHVVLYNAWGWDYGEPANFIHEVIEERGDPNMSWATFPWLFEQWHGCEYDHSGMAHVLAEHLRSLAGFEEWAPGTADVMNGYGVDGDVANGGFEEEAPFGGYGWRYFTDAGVDRLSDGTAHGGEYYLQLHDGAASHQPNPALEGETFTVTAWVRPKSEGDTVEVTIDFRDQEMWTAPLESYTKSFTLENSGWTFLEMSATAPFGTANPVFHTRLTFQAGSGSTVDVDDVVMSVDGGGGGGICEDDDGDGFGNPGSPYCPNGGASDCNDSDPAVNPAAQEICGNGVDDNCNGAIDADDPVCPISQCAVTGEACTGNGDCCSGSCSKGKPSSRICL